MRLKAIQLSKRLRECAAITLAVIGYATLSFAAAAERVLMVSSEQTGVANTGGLGHTVAGLSQALNEEGVPTDVIMPYFESMPEEVRSHCKYENISISTGNGDSLFDLYSLINPENGVKTYLLRHRSRYLLEKGSWRDATSYTGSGGLFDSANLSSLEGQVKAYEQFGEAVAKFLIGHEGYTIVDFHDWHTGPAVYHFNHSRRLSPRLKNVRSLFTISNMGYQGVLGPETVRHLRMEYMESGLNNAEFFRGLNLLKAGMNADVSITVAPNYSQELDQHRFSLGLEGRVHDLKEHGRFTSILNGIDTEKWNPERPGFTEIQERFSVDDLSGKLRGKLALQKSMGFAQTAKVPLLALTSRVAGQKGWDYLILSIEDILKTEEVQVLIVGDGEARYLTQIAALQAKYSSKLKRVPFSKSMEAKSTFYADFFVNTPWYEPSGTNHAYAMRTGAVPIVSKTGGLVHYVNEGNDGFLAEIHVSNDGISTDIEKTRQSLNATVRRALATYKEMPNEYLRLQRNAMKKRFPWKPVVQKYLSLFHYLRYQGWETFSSKPTEDSSLENLRMGSSTRCIEENLQLPAR